MMSIKAVYWSVFYINYEFLLRICFFHFWGDKYADFGGDKTYLNDIRFE